MSTGPLMPFVRAQWLSSTGVPLAGYKLFTYLAGTDTPTDTFTTSAISTANAWPVVLDSAGRATVYLDPALSYKFVMADPTSTAITGPLGIVWTNDTVPGLVDPFSPPVTFEIDAIGSTPTDAAIFLNATSAANNAQQWSPRIRFTGQGWNATAAASRVVDATEEAVPIQQASGDPVVALTFSTQVNGGGYSPRAAIRSDGAVALGPSGAVAWSSSGLTSIDTRIARIGAQALTLGNAAATTGAVLSGTVADRLSVRNLANTDDGQLYAASLNLSAASASTLAITGGNAGGRVAGFLRNNGGSSAGTVSAFNIGQTDNGGIALVILFNHNTGAALIHNQLAATGTLELSCASGSVTIGNTGSFLLNQTAATISWSAQSVITNTANGSLKLTNNAGTAGVLLKFSTDQLLQLRNRADSDFADFQALNIDGTGFSVSGTPGLASFSGVVTSITVVQGIVTAAS